MTDKTKHIVITVVMVAFILGALVYTVCYHDEMAARPSMARAKAKLKF